jgi:Zn-dependent protease with chaperone function
MGMGTVLLQGLKKERTAMAESFPSINVAGDRVDPKSCVAEGTAFFFYLAATVSALGLIAGVIASKGILLVFILIGALGTWLMRKRALAMIHGSGLKVSATQLPEIDECVRNFSERLGITAPVDVYVVEQSVMNAAVVRYGRKNVILLTDDLIHGCLRSGVPMALAYVIGHELGHVALKHNDIVRSWIRQNIKKLGRLDEYSCDCVALRLVGDRNIALCGLLLLTVGHSVMPYVDADSLVTQANEVAANKYTKKAERAMTHPLLLNRIHRILNH